MDSSRLVCTGLYDPTPGTAEQKIAPGIEAYEPGFRLWSDGLEKARYIYLPPGARIDTRDMDEWTFPIGTRFWKEFRWHGRRIETRYLEKTGPDAWRGTTFAWNATSRTPARSTVGQTIMLDGGHGPYDIPGPDDCGRCHGGRRDNVLGFEALALAAPEATGLTLARLAARRAPHAGAGRRGDLGAGDAARPQRARLAAHELRRQLPQREPGCRRQLRRPRSQARGGRRGGSPSDRRPPHGARTADHRARLP